MSHIGYPVDPAHGLREMIELWTATSADELHRVLVLYPPVRVRAYSAFEPFALFEQHHRSEPESSLITATLLLTDRRWRNAAAHLVRQIADSGMLAGEDLDLLARTFLAADDAVYWQVPDEWFDGGAEIVIEILGGELDDADDVDLDEGPAVARRDVAPPLRRWAAAHLLVHEPAAWPALWRRAEDLRARDAAAVAAGLLDRVDVLPPAAQRFVVEHATTWPDQAVRRLALEWIAAHDGPDVAADLGRNDPNARIRTWAAGLVASADGARSGGRAAAAPQGELSAQPSLF